MIFISSPEDSEESGVDNRSFFKSFLASFLLRLLYFIFSFTGFFLMALDFFEDFRGFLFLIVVDFRGILLFFCSVYLFLF